MEGCRCLLSSSGAARWAHVGGFLFGALAVLGLRYSGLEHKVNEAIEAKATRTADRETLPAPSESPGSPFRTRGL